jgi:YidC/Oxa1 family membrane protein insertase
MRWYQSKSFKKAQKNAPAMKELQEKMKELQRKGIPADDPRMREVQMQQLKMTKDAIPIGGCLPLLLQMPLLIALYTAVTISVDFRQASFLWLPDLSTVDPYYILPFMFAGSMFISMLITPTTVAVTPEQQMQQNMMKYLMPLMMLWIGWTVPSGLLVYWILGNVVSFVQQKFINNLNKDDTTTPGDTITNTNVLTKKSKLSTT